MAIVTIEVANCPTGKKAKRILGAIEVSNRHLKLNLSNTELISPLTSAPAAFSILVAEVRNLGMILNTFFSLLFHIYSSR